MKLPRYQLSHQFITLSCIFSVLLILSCKKEKPAEIKNLEFAHETYYIPKGENVHVLVADGNRKYSLSGFDDALIAPTVSITDFPAGAIYITGLKKGKSNITIRDEVSGQESQLTIHVVDPFLALGVSDILPLVEDGDYETNLAIRDKVNIEPQSFFGFENQEVLILQRNANNQFWLFKNEADAARGTIHKSGTFTLEFSFSGPNRLLLDYGDSDETSRYDMYVPDQTAFSTLLKWSRESGAENGTEKVQSNVLMSSDVPVIAETPQNTSVVENPSQLFLIKDFTSFFKEMYPNVKRVDLFQGMRFYDQHRYLNIAEGILN